jgi:small subunit ribosomal protein S1
MPISQIDLGRVENPEQFVHQRLKCIVTDVDPADRNLIVSRRALLEKEREELREKLWGALAEGQVREGVVRNVREFGAFVDLGGVDGLLHVGEMSWKRVADPTTIVQPGQRLKVVILRIDQQTRKLSLGLKQLEANPWDAVTQNYHVGQVIKGKVVRTQDFGAFVELEPGIEGLIHVSEIARGKVWRVADHVKVGQEVESKILSIDPEARRIGLSLKQALPEPVVKPVEEEEEPEVAPTPVKVKKRVTPLRGGTGTGPLFSLPTPPPAPPATES